MLNGYVVSVEVSEAPGETWNMQVFHQASRINEAMEDVRDLFGRHNLKARVVHCWEVD